MNMAINSHYVRSTHMPGSTERKYVFRAPKTGIKAICEASTFARYKVVS